MYVTNTQPKFQDLQIVLPSKMYTENVQEQREINVSILIYTCN